MSHEPATCFLCQKVFDSDDFDNYLLALEHIFTDHLEPTGRNRMQPSKYCWCKGPIGADGEHIDLYFTGFVIHLFYVTEGEDPNRRYRKCREDAEKFDRDMLARCQVHYTDVMLGVRDDVQ